MAVARPYHCPICFEIFTKWGLCRTHLSGSVLCSRALEIQLGGGSGSASRALSELEDRELQQYCRTPAGNPAEEATSTSVALRLIGAQKAGFLTEVEHLDIVRQCPELSELASAVQNSILERFLAPGRGNFKWISNKLDWFRRCLEFSKRTACQTDPANKALPAASLVSALASHCLLPEAICQDFCNRYLRMAPEIQSEVVSALFASVPTSEKGDFLKLFEHLCLNEEFISRLTKSPPQALDPQPQQAQFKDLTWGLYHNMLHKTLLFRRDCDEQIFDFLADAVRKGDSRSEDSLIVTHAATKHDRQTQNALNSLLHAVVVHGHIRVLARLIAEGFDVNELAGAEKLAPLHLAASTAAFRGDSRVIKLLLDKAADVHLQDGAGHTAMHHAIQADGSIGVGIVGPMVSSSTGSASPAVFLDREVQFDACNLLLHAGSPLEPELSGEILAAEMDLIALQNLIRLHRRLRPLIDRFKLDKMAIGDLEHLEYETQIYVLELFTRMKVKEEAAALELSALIRSAFIQKTNLVQKLGKRLANKLNLSAQALEALAKLPPSAGHFAMETYKIQEVERNIFSESGAAAVAEGQSSASSRGAAPQQEKRPRVSGEVRGADIALSEGFMRHIGSSSVKEAAKSDNEKWLPWLRCLGLQESAGQHGPADKAVWRQEIDLRIGVLLSKATTPLTKEDFNAVLVTFLYKFAVRGSASRVSEVLSMIEASVVGMERNDKPSWPTHLKSFLQHLDPILFRKIAERGGEDDPEDVCEPLASAHSVAQAMAAEATASAPSAGRR